MSLASLTAALVCVTYRGVKIGNRFMQETLGAVRVWPLGRVRRRGNNCNKDRKVSDKKGTKRLKKCAKGLILKFFMRIGRVFNMEWQVELAKTRVVLVVQNERFSVTPS